MISSKALMGLAGFAIMLTVVIYSSSNTTDVESAQVSAKVDKLNEIQLKETDVILRGLAVKNKKIHAENERIKKELLSLKSKMKRGDETQDSKPNPDNVALIEKMSKKIESLEQKISINATKTEQTLSAYQINRKIKNITNRRLASGEYIDLDAIGGVDKIKGSSPKDRMVALHKRILGNKPAFSESEEKEKTIPFYTIPAGSDIQNSTLLTSLIGIVPVKGKLAQPLFPFSTIISRGDLMAANGMSLPKDIIGMKVGGFVYGVGSFLDNISCVRAYATSMLFVFQDGRFTTILDNSQQNSSTTVSNDSIGYLTDQFGNPCIKGKYISNAPNVTGALMLAGGASGVGNGITAWQQSTSYGQGGVTRMPTGSLGAAIGGQMLSNGSSMAGEWIKDRVDGSFDIVKVPASYPVKYNGRLIFRPNRMMLHITKNISIDKSSVSRRLNYGQANKAFDNRF